MEWDVGGLTATVDDLSMDHRTISLQHTVTDTIEIWRGYRRADDVETITGAGGSFRAFDRSGRAKSPITITPPADDEPTPFDSFEALVVGYSETQEAPGVFTIELELARTSNRPRVFASSAFGLVFTVGSPSGNSTSASWESGPWELEFSMGTIGLEEDMVLRSEFDGDPAAGEWTLPILLDDVRARVLMESLSHVDATVKRSVPDGKDFVVDATTNDKNTLKLTAPSRATLQSGTYIVTEWELHWYSYRRRWHVDLSMSFVASPSGTFDASFDTGLA